VIFVPFLLDVLTCANSVLTEPFCRPNELSDGVDTELCGAQ
jgi:hypothetical protein